MRSGSASVDRMVCATCEARVGRECLLLAGRAMELLSAGRVSVRVRIRAPLDRQPLRLLTCVLAQSRYLYLFLRDAAHCTPPSVPLHPI